MLRTLLPGLLVAALCVACESVPQANAPSALTGTGGVASADGKVASGSGAQQSGPVTTRSTPTPTTWRTMQASAPASGSVAPKIDQVLLQQSWNANLPRGSTSLEATTSQAAMNAAHNAAQAAVPGAAPAAPVPSGATPPMPAAHETLWHEMHETPAEEAREHGHH